ncbi:MAG: ATP-binding cassette domain-containing protein [Kiloniellales bacterium]
MTLELQNLSLSLGGRRLFAPLSLTVQDGEIVTVMGASGSGKSSLLDFLCGTLDRNFATEGRVLLEGVDLASLPPERRRVGILFQDDLLFPHLSVGENLAFGLPPDLRDRSSRRAEIARALSDAGLEGFESRDPMTLSGGQRARVALLRTLLARPRALLLDEPFAKLDVGLRDRIRSFVFTHARAKGLPTLLVTHDPDDAQAAAGPVVALASLGNGDANGDPDPGASQAG